MPPVIEVKELVKKYKDMTAVNGASFTVAEGEVFGFLGPNGAGKSTTIKILATLLKPSSGTALINGHDVLKHPNRVRQSIGLVFQDPSLDERLTARENLFFHAMLYNVDTTLFKQRMADVLSMVELEDRKNSLVKSFSGGMKRRLEIARGLLHYPRVLFLDEPTVGLDPQTRSRIWDYIKELRVREGLTIFMTTHYMDEAENCDRIAIIDHGAIVALDTPDNLKKMVGKDQLSLSTGDNDKVRRLIAGRYGITATLTAGGLQMEVEQGEKFIPELAGELKGLLLSISLRKPALDDVFLKLTGREIRAETAEPWGAMRVHARLKRK